MDKQMFGFLFWLAVFVAFWSRDLSRALEEENDWARRLAAGAGPAAGLGLEELAVDVANLLILVKTMQSSDSQGQGGLLAYSLISEQASRIGMTAEKRRLMLARSHLENILTEEVRCLDASRHG